MLEKITYINHMNESIDFGQNGIYVNYNDLRDFSWDFESTNNKITSFSKKIREKKIPVIIHCNSEEKGVEIKNRLFEVTEKDVLAFEYGRIVIGDYYLKCYVKGSSKSEYLQGKNHLKTELQIVTDLPEWIRISDPIIFAPGASTSAGQNKDYPHDYKYDYSNSMERNLLYNTSFVDADFEMVIHGACANPSIVIGDHMYEVETGLLTGERLVINSKTKKIYKVKTSGETVNQFHLRNRDSYIFEKIPTGTSSASWNGMFRFEITILEERSEPKWT